MKRREFLTAGALASMPALASAQTPPVVLPPLPYPADALEPFIDARTMEIHHGKHHQAYVDNLNKALATHRASATQPVESLLGKLDTLPAAIRTAVRNNGGGHVNHALFWQTLGRSKAAPSQRLEAAMRKAFGGRQGLEERLRTAGLSVFGSGWVWVSPQGKDSLEIETSPNQDGPWMAGRRPLFGIDVWEHAYYLKYQNRRADYLAAVVQVINWDFVSQRYEELVK
jgi:Fe-Mn family superoxide dismutase